MTHTIRFFVPGTPRAKQYRQTSLGVIYNKGEAVVWEKACAQAAMVAAGAGWKPVFGAVSIDLAFRMAVPKSRKDVKQDEPHLQDPDLTNLLKACEDGIKKVLFLDDNLVWRMRLTKQWVKAGEEGVEVMVVIEKIPS